jgi:hypothetical protein
LDNQPEASRERDDLDFPRLGFEANCPPPQSEDRRDDDRMFDVALEIAIMNPQKLAEKVRQMFEAGVQNLLFETDDELARAEANFIMMQVTAKRARRKLSEAFEAYAGSPAPAA